MKARFPAAAAALMALAGPALADDAGLARAQARLAAEQAGIAAEGAKARDAVTKTQYTCTTTDGEVLAVEHIEGTRNGHIIMMDGTIVPITGRRASHNGHKYEFDFLRRTVTRDQQPIGLCEAEQPKLALTGDAGLAKAQARLAAEQARMAAEIAKAHAAGVSEPPKPQYEPITLTPAQIAAIEAEIELSLIDPYSAHYHDILAVKSTDDRIVRVCGYVNAKNSLGGYTGRTPFQATIYPMLNEDDEGFVLGWIASDEGAYNAFETLSKCREYGIDLFPGAGGWARN